MLTTLFGVGLTSRQQVRGSFVPRRSNQEIEDLLA